MKKSIIILSVLFAIAMTSCDQNKETYKFLDEEYKTFYV